MKWNNLFLILVYCQKNTELDLLTKKPTEKTHSDMASSLVGPQSHSPAYPRNISSNVPCPGASLNLLHTTRHSSPPVSKAKLNIACNTAYIAVYCPELWADGLK
jgi:hypothetical protein